MTEGRRRFGRAVLPAAAFGLAAWRCAGLPMPTDTAFHLVRAGNHLLRGSIAGWAVPPGGEHASVLGAFITAFGALFADSPEAKLLVGGCVLLGLAAAILVHALAREDGPVIAVVGLACLILPPGFASAFSARPDAALAGVLLLLAATRVLRAKPIEHAALPLWVATLTTPWAIPAALAAHATAKPRALHRKTLAAPLVVLLLVAGLSWAIPPPGRGELVRGLFGDLQPSLAGVRDAILELRRGWTEGILAAAFLASQIPAATRLPAGVLIPWIAAAATAFFLGAPGAFLGATATLAPVTALGIARAAARASRTVEPLGSVPRPVMVALLVPMIAFLVGSEPNRRIRSALRSVAVREAQIGAFLWKQPAAGAVLAERTGAIAAFSGRPAESPRGGPLPEPPPLWIVFSEGQQPRSVAEQDLFENPAFLANFALYELRRGRRSEILDGVWVRRSSAVEPAKPGYAAALSRAWAQRNSGDTTAVLTSLQTAAGMEPAGLGLAHEELGLEWARRGDGPASQALLEDARRRDPACARARAHLADRAISRGEVFLADTLVAELSRFQRDLAEVHGLRARLFAAAGWAEDAEAESDRAVEAGPDVARLLVNHGILLWRRGAADEAREHWRRAVRADPNTLRYLGAFEEAPDDAPAPPLGPVLSDFGFTLGRPRAEAADAPPVRRK